MSNERKIDALIATHIFSLQPFTILPKNGCSSEVFWIEWLENGKERGVDLPHYSTDIAAAMEVFDEIRKNHRVCISADDEDFLVEIEVQTTSHHVAEYQETASITLPIAICLAALKLKGIDYD